MLIIHGRKEARIKIFTDNETSCQNCKDFDFDIWIFREYYHIFFIPICPVGEKTTKIRCNNCGVYLRSDSLSEKYSEISKTPFYFYIIPLLFTALIVGALVGNLFTQNEKAAFVENPLIGDVYRIRNEKDVLKTYSFLRITNIKGDTVVAYHNNLRYLDFVTKMDAADFFVKEEEVYYTKEELRQMLEKDEINAVERNYGDEEGFNRIR
jgi:hypothetical protein